MVMRLRMEPKAPTNMGEVHMGRTRMVARFSLIAQVCLLIAACVFCVSCDRNKRSSKVLSKNILVGTYVSTRPSYTERLEIRIDGTYRQSVWKPGEPKPLYLGAWERWSLASDRPEGFRGTIALYRITFWNWWAADGDWWAPDGHGDGGTKLDQNATYVEKFPNGEIRIVRDGPVDYWAKVADKAAGAESSP